MYVTGTYLKWHRVTLQLLLNGGDGHPLGHITANLLRPVFAFLDVVVVGDVLFHNLGVADLLGHHIAVFGRFLCASHRLLAPIVLLLLGNLKQANKPLMLCRVLVL